MLILLRIITKNSKKPVPRVFFWAEGPKPTEPEHSDIGVLKEVQIQIFMSKEEDLNPVACKSKKKLHTKPNFMRNLGEQHLLFQQILGKKVQNLLLKIHVVSFNRGM